MTPQSAKAKGRELQQKVRNDLLPLHPGFRPEDIRSTPMGVTGPDLLLSPFASDILGIQVECKRRAKFPHDKDWEQAVGHGDKEPVLVCRSDRKKALAIISWDHYLELLKAKITLDNELDRE